MCVLEWFLIGDFLVGEWPSGLKFLCFSLKDIFKIKSMMYLRKFRLSLERTKVYFDCVDYSCHTR